MVATQVAMLASIFQLAWLWRKTGKLQKFSLVSCISILLLGGATLFFKNEIFVKWKPTVVYWALSIVLLGSQFFTAQPLMQKIAGKGLQLPDRIWRTLNLSWSGFFILLGIVNLYVVYNYSTDAWVNFKLFGTLGITLVFVILQSIFMARHTHLQNGN